MLYPEWCKCMITNRKIEHESPYDTEVGRSKINKDLQIHFVHLLHCKLSMCISSFIGYIVIYGENKPNKLSRQPKMLCQYPVHHVATFMTDS